MDATKALILDLDGVLTDTAELHYRAWQRLADEAQLPFDRRANAALRGVPREESLRRLLAGRTVSPEAFAEMLDRKNRYYLEQVDRLSPRHVVPGAADLLTDARAAGLRLAVVSASRNARRVLDRLDLGHWFDCIIDGNAGVPGKPAPDPFLLAAKRLSVRPTDCVVFEDAPAGLAAARAARMRCIAVGSDALAEPADGHILNLNERTLAELLEFEPAYGALPTV